MKKYLYSFFYDDEAVETIEWMAILSVTAALIAIAAKVATSLKGKLSTMGSYL